MNILQVMPIIVPHTSDGICSCAEIPQWLEIGIFGLIGLLLLVALIMLIKIIFLIF